MNVAIGIGIGLVAGIASGMLGIGGGVILIPGMVLLIGVAQHTAVITVVALVGTITHYRQQNIRLGVALWIIPSAVVFSFLGGVFADMLDAALLRNVWGALLIVVGIVMMVTGRRSVSA
jgi:uncharacterized membrane protein YfcA